MPISIRAYQQAIEQALKESPFVHEQHIIRDDRGEVWFLRGDIYFIDNSRLHFRELHVREDEFAKKSYVYHYQDFDENLIFRYDNAPHFPDLPSAPHHKHIGDKQVIASAAPSFAEILSEIHILLK